MCLVGVKTGRMENRERKIRWKMSFFTVWLRKENRRYRKQGEKVFPPKPTFFILPNWEQNGEGKVVWNAFYTNTLSPTAHFIHDLMTFASSDTYHFTFSQHSNVQVLFSPFFTWSDQVDTFFCWIPLCWPRFCGLNVV